MPPPPASFRLPAYTERRLLTQNGVRRVRVNAADPCYTATDFNGRTGPQTVVESTDAIVAPATGSPEAGMRGFVDRLAPMPW